MVIGYTSPQDETSGELDTRPARRPQRGAPRSRLPGSRRKPRPQDHEGTVDDMLDEMFDMKQYFTQPRRHRKQRGVARVHALEGTEYHAEQGSP